MSNLFKKVTSAVAGLAIVFSMVSPIAGVSAAFTSLEAANKLATLGVIVDQSSNPADYRLGDTLTRREHVKVAMNLASCQAVSVPDTCNGSFSDMDSSDWGCKYAETALANGFVAANATFGPGRDVSKAEALKMIMNATNVAQSDNAVWQASYVEGAISAGVLSESFTDYDAAASRGWIFQVAAEAVDLCNGGEVAEEEEDDLLGSLLEGLGGDDEDEEEESGSDDGGSNPTVSGSNNLVVSLSPSTPESSTVPGGANGVPVASFDVTAGDSDIIVDGFILKRKGLSDEDTLTALAVFGENGRVSKSRDDSQENDDQANLNFNEEEVVLAGETRTFVVVADVSRSIASNDEFSIELLDIETNANVSFEGRLVGETFRVAGVDAPQIVFSQDGTVTDPSIGDTDAEIFKFEIEGADDEDVIVKSMTFRSTETDIDDNLRNYKLLQNNDVLATTEFSNEEYLTFDLGEGFVVEEDTDLSFKVTADVVEGATDNFTFFVDRNLDITAISTKFDTVASVDIDQVDNDGAINGTAAVSNNIPTDNFGSVDIEAGELVITRINPEVDEIKEDKDDVILGEFTVENQSGGDLDLEEFGVLVTLNGAAFFDNGAGTNSGNGVQDGDEDTVTAENVFDDFELLNKNTGRTDTLEFTNGVYQDDSLGINLVEGITEFVLRADTADGIEGFDNLSIELSFQTGRTNIAAGRFVVEEQEDDEEVDDISPSFISFDNLDGIESTADLSANPLATTTAVRGAEDIEVLEFEVEADEASTLEIDEIRIAGRFFASGATFNPASTAGTVVTAPGSNISNQILSNISIYLDSVSPSNLLESQGGSEIENNGEITFNDFDNIFIQPNQTQTFVVVVDIIDGDTVENITLGNFHVVDIDIDDEDNDDVEPSGTAVSANRIIVTGAGLLTASFDASNEANEDPKTLLAGSDDQVVFSLDVQSTNEPTDVEDVVFTLAGSNLTNLRNTISNASIYLDGVFIDQNTNSDIDVQSATAATITFDDLDDLIIPEQTSELELRLNSESIGFQRVGDALNNVTITQVEFLEIEGDESDEDVDDLSVVNGTAVTGTSQPFSFARGVLVPRISSGVNTSNPIVGVVADLGDNRADNDNTIPNITLNTFTFDVSGTTVGTTITLQNSDGTNSDVQTVLAGTPPVVFDLAAAGFTTDERIVSSGNEEFFELQIVTPDVESPSVSVELLRDGLNYSLFPDSNNPTTPETFTTNASDDLEVTTY